jgi:uncharacterized membrane-anchored protein YitT (DUF2179 family)
MEQNNTFYKVRRVAMVFVAAFVMAMNVNTFVHAGDLFPAGVMGLTVFIQRVFSTYFGIELLYSPVNIALNIIPVYIGFRFIGKKFTLLSLLMIVVNSFLVDILPVRALTYDPLLIAVFGGVLNGIAIAICLRADATSGGTDFIAIFLSQKKGMEGFNVVLYFNSALLLTAGFLFGWDKALYSIIFQYVSTQVLHLLYQNYYQQTLFVITDQPEKICKVIYDTCHHGATIMHGEGSYDHADRGVVYSVVSSVDTKKVILAIRQADPAAFVNSLKTEKVRGNFYLKPRD